MMKIRVLILGTTGMLGHTLFRKLSRKAEFEVFGTCRNTSIARAGLEKGTEDRVIPGVTVENFDTIVAAAASIKPHVLVNCIGLIKQLESSSNPLSAIPINALLPHRLSLLCKAVGARLVHFSTDCVFSGRKGNYREDHIPDANDLYGRSKLLGEVVESHTVTLRTSIIGHELRSSISLIDWFLSQTVPVKGYASAIYSGLPTVEMARILAEVVIPNLELNGLYHVASRPISKLELLKLIARQYGTITTIIPDAEVTIDRSLDSSRFTSATGYSAPSWAELVTLMHRDYLSNCQ